MGIVLPVKEMPFLCDLKQTFVRGRQTCGGTVAYGLFGIDPEAQLQPTKSTHHHGQDGDKNDNANTRNCIAQSCQKRDEGNKRREIKERGSSRCSNVCIIIINSSAASQQDHHSKSSIIAPAPVTMNSHNSHSESANALQASQTQGNQAHGTNSSSANDAASLTEVTPGQHPSEHQSQSEVQPETQFGLPVPLPSASAPDYNNGVWIPNPWSPTSDPSCIFQYIRSRNNNNYHLEGTFSARQICAFIDENPHQLRLWLQLAPLQVASRIGDGPCLWEGCPDTKIRPGWYQVAFDEFADQTTAGGRDPFQVAGHMHLYCYEKCFDALVDHERAILYPEMRVFPHETRNPMMLERQKDRGVIQDAYDLWFVSARANTAAGPVGMPRPFHSTLGWALANHRSQQTNTTSTVQDRWKGDLKGWVESQPRAAPSALDPSAANTSQTRTNRPGATGVNGERVGDYIVVDWLGAIYGTASTGEEADVDMQETDGAVPAQAEAPRGRRRRDGSPDGGSSEDDDGLRRSKRARRPIQRFGE